MLSASVLNLPRVFCHKLARLTPRPAAALTSLPDRSQPAVGEPGRAWRMHDSVRTSCASGRSAHVKASQQSSFATVSVQEAAKMLGEGWSYIDVRTPGEFSQGHPPGAVNIPVTQPDSRGMMTINQDFVAKVEEAFPEKDTNLLMGCKVGQRSAMAAQMLQSIAGRVLTDTTGVEYQQEYVNLANIAGGFDHWQGHGLPVEK